VYRLNCLKQSSGGDALWNETFGAAFRCIQNAFLLREGGSDNDPGCRIFSAYFQQVLDNIPFGHFEVQE
jgi:hypothetical protein